MIKQLIPKAYASEQVTDRGMLSNIHPDVPAMYATTPRPDGGYTVPVKPLLGALNVRKDNPGGIPTAWGNPSTSWIGGDGTDAFPHTLAEDETPYCFAAKVLRQANEIEYFFMKALELPILASYRAGYLAEYTQIIDAIKNFGGFSEDNHLRNAYLAVAALEAMAVLTAAVAEDLARHGVVMGIRVLRWDAMQCEGGGSLPPSGHLVIGLGSYWIPVVANSMDGVCKVWKMQDSLYLGLDLNPSDYAWLMPKLAPSSIYRNGDEDRERTWAMAIQPTKKGAVAYRRCSPHQSGQSLRNLGVGGFCIPAKLSKNGGLTLAGTPNATSWYVGSMALNVVKEFLSVANQAEFPQAHELYMRGPTLHVQAVMPHMVVQCSYGYGFTQVAQLPTVYEAQEDGLGGIIARDSWCYEMFGHSLNAYKRVIENPLESMGGGGPPPKRKTLFGTMAKAEPVDESVDLLVETPLLVGPHLEAMIALESVNTLGWKLMSAMVHGRQQFDTTSNTPPRAIPEGILAPGQELYAATTGSDQARHCAAQCLLVSHHLMRLVMASARTIRRKSMLLHKPALQEAAPAAEIHPISSIDWGRDNRMWITNVKHEQSSAGKKPYVVNALRGGPISEIPGCGDVDYLPGHTSKAAEIASRYADVTYAMSIMAMLPTENSRHQKFQAVVGGSRFTYKGPAIYLELFRNGRYSQVLVTTGEHINEFYTKHLPEVMEAGFRADPDEIYWLRSNQCQRARNKDQDEGVSLATPAGRLEPLSIWLEETYPQLIEDTEGVRVSVFTKDQLAAAFSAVS